MVAWIKSSIVKWWDSGYILKGRAIQKNQMWNIKERQQSGMTQHFLVEQWGNADCY